MAVDQNPPPGEEVRGAEPVFGPAELRYFASPLNKNLLDLTLDHRAVFPGNSSGAIQGDLVVGVSGDLLRGFVPLHEFALLVEEVEDAWQGIDNLTFEKSRSIRSRSSFSRTKVSARFWVFYVRMSAEPFDDFPSFLGSQRHGARFLNQQR